MSRKGNERRRHLSIDQGRTPICPFPSREMLWTLRVDEVTCVKCAQRVSEDPGRYIIEALAFKNVEFIQQFNSASHLQRAEVALKEAQSRLTRLREAFAHASP